VVAPPGVLDEKGRVDLAPWLAKQEEKREAAKKKGN
jgi:hypothetical protein